MNMNSNLFERKASSILSVLGSPFRVKLVLTLGDQEACVCHLEALLKKRQAYISQHLMALRQAGLLTTRRDGKYVYYRLSDPAVIDLIRDAASIAGLTPDQLPKYEKEGTLERCECPHCNNKEDGPGKGTAPLQSVEIK